MNKDNVIEFVTARWANTTCHRCGANNWACGSASDLTAKIPLGDVGVVTIFAATKSLPTAWLACQQCGTVEFVAARVIKEWIDAGKPEVRS